MNLDHLKYCTSPEHKAGYNCSRCRRTYCLTCDHASSVEMIKTIVRYCPDWRCQREHDIENGTAALSGPAAACRGPTMYATLRRGAQVAGTVPLTDAELAELEPLDPAEPNLVAAYRALRDGLPVAGDLVLVEVPPNCTIHSADAATMAELMVLAKMIGEHWRDQQGVNASLLDRLAELTENLTVIDRIDADSVDVRLL